MSDSPTQPLVRSHEVRAILVAYLLLLLLAAAVNVPLAVALQRGPRSPRLPTLDLRGTAAPSRWPASTPHAAPWPAPNYWSESKAFGYGKYGSFE